MALAIAKRLILRDFVIAAAAAAICPLCSKADLLSR